MKKLIFILFVLMISSCKKDDIKKQNDLYTEWQWEATLWLNGDVYKSAQESDTTYYYNFRNDGILEIKDINQTIKYENEFKIQNQTTLTIKDLPFNYSIENNRLRISNVYGILVWINVFKSVEQ